MDANPTTYKLRRTAESPDLLVEGLIPGVDVAGTIEGDVFTPDAELAPEHRGLPMYVILDFRDVDRVVGKMEFSEAGLRRSLKIIQAEIKKIQARKLRFINWFAELIPPPPDDRKWRDTKGPFTRGNYRYQNERALNWSLVDTAEARAAGLLKLTEPTEEPIGNGVLNAYYAEHRRAPPGYDYEYQMPVSFTPASDPKSTEEQEF